MCLLLLLLIIFDIQDIVATSDQISWSSSSDIESDSPNVVDSGVEHSAFAALDNVQDDMIEYDSNIDEIVNDVPVFPKRNFFIHHKFDLTVRCNYVEDH